MQCYLVLQVFHIQEIKLNLPPLANKQLWDVLPQDKGEELAKQLNFSGYISVDIAQPNSVEAAAKRTLELLNGVKLVGCVHCAGIALRVSDTYLGFDRFKFA